MISKPYLALLTVLIFFATGCTKTKEKSATSNVLNFEGIEFEMPQIQLPVIPDFTVNILEFGGIPDGRTLNTLAFANAIDAVTEKGGGKVIVPAGIWLTGPITLKSNLEIYTESGALIIFSPDKDLYPIIETTFEGLDTWRCLSPIYGKNIENVALTGSGVWDGSGDAWRFVRKNKLDENQWKKLIDSGGYLNEKKDEWYPSEQFKKAMEMSDMNVPTQLKTKEEFEAVRDFLRPVMVSIQNSKNIMLNGPTFQNSPAWCLHPFMVEHLVVKNITVRNPWYSQNGDGIDIESCKNVLVDKCNFDVGDDAICIKSGKDEDGRRRGVPCENLIIRDNIVYHGHGGVTIGSEMSGGVKNMHVSNCTFMGTDVGLRFKSNRGRGGVVENIYISDIYMTDIPTNAISFNLYYGGKSMSQLIAEGGQSLENEIVPVSVETPLFKNISIKNITLKGALQAIYMQGLPEMNLEDISLTDMDLVADSGFLIVDADGIKIENVNLHTKSETAFQLYNCKNIKIDNTEFNSESSSAVKVNGKKTTDISLDSKQEKQFINYTSIGTEVAEGSVKF